MSTHFVSKGETLVFLRKVGGDPIPATSLVSGSSLLLLCSLFRFCCSVSLLCGCLWCCFPWLFSLRCCDLRSLLSRGLSAPPVVGQLFSALQIWLLRLFSSPAFSLPGRFFWISVFLPGVSFCGSGTLRLIFGASLRSKILMSTHVIRDDKALAMWAHVVAGFSLRLLFSSLFPLGSGAVALFRYSWLSVVVDLVGGWPPVRRSGGRWSVGCRTCCRFGG
jgi:hypothetical protein